MHDERVPRGTLLGGKDLCDGLGIKRIRTEPVDGLGRKGDRAPTLKNLCSSRDRFPRGLGLKIGGVNRQPQGFHRGLSLPVLTFSDTLIPQLRIRPLKVADHLDALRRSEIDDVESLFAQKGETTLRVHAIAHDYLPE